MQEGNVRAAEGAGDGQDARAAFAEQQCARSVQGARRNIQRHGVWWQLATSVMMLVAVLS